MKLPPLSQLPETPNDAQIDAILLKGVINTIYTTGADEIIERESDGKKITGIFRDGDEYFDFEYEDGGLGYKPIEYKPKKQLSLDPESVKGGEIHNYIEFINSQPRSNSDILTDRLVRESEAEFSAMVAQIEDLLNTEDSLELAQAKVAGLYSQLKATTLEKQLALGSQAIALAGAVDARDELDIENIEDPK